MTRIIRFTSSHFPPPEPSLIPVGNNSQKCCIHKKDGSPNLQQQTGGQQFTDALGGGWNGELPTIPLHLTGKKKEVLTSFTHTVIIAYANCNHSPYQIPSTYNGGTVNGPGCLPAQFYIG